MIDRIPVGRAVLDGRIVAPDELVIPWADPAAQWGLGVFATIAVRSGLPRHLAEHGLRLSAAARRFGIALPPEAELTRAARLVAEGVSGGHGWLKIVASRSGRWMVCAGPEPADREGGPVSAVVLPWRRHRLDPSVAIKSTGYAAGLLGLEEARRRGADEGLWLNDRGHVIGACTGNLFVIRGRAAVTPSLSDGARDGVTREKAIPALAALGLQVRQGKIRILTLRGVDEVFLTSSLGGVRPVVRIDGREVHAGRTGSIARRLGDRLMAEQTAPNAVSSRRDE